jgi:hypothetical protein
MENRSAPRCVALHRLAREVHALPSNRAKQDRVTASISGHPVVPEMFPAGHPERESACAGQDVARGAALLKRHLVRAVFKLLNELSMNARRAQPATFPAWPVSALALT